MQAAQADSRSLSSKLQSSSTNPDQFRDASSVDWVNLQNLPAICNTDNPTYSTGVALTAQLHMKTILSALRLRR